MSAPAYFVSGIGTEVGKTVSSALLVRHFQADYWKPIQSGDLDYSDTDKVTTWAELDPERVHPERFRFKTPASPHYAAALEGQQIQVSDFRLPVTDQPLIVEGAGGLLVPLNDQQTILDLIAYLHIPVFLVSRHYLGSINHTLMSIAMLRARSIPIAGLIYSGVDDKDTVDIIQRQTGLAPFWEIGELPSLEPTVFAARLSEL
ncbi:MAG: dethiobiotin synthase [Bacteroidota bacterium]